jgi:hypothetical protein
MKTNHLRFVFFFFDTIGPQDKRFAGGGTPWRGWEGDANRKMDALDCLTGKDDCFEINLKFHSFALSNKKMKSYD